MKFKLSLYVLGLLSLIVIATGMLYFLRQHLLGYHAAFLEMTEPQLNSFDPRIMPLYFALTQITGSCMIATGLTSFLLVAWPLRHRIRWAWWTLVALLPFPLGVTSVVSYHISRSIAEGPRPPYWLAMGILALFILAMIFAYPGKTEPEKEISS
ncbi:MAG TPA: hypothetical protein VMC08_01120 [Bacteroidales bacterium]|nr:hypothetical protein [Bacteroidales bacterium]